MSYTRLAYPSGIYRNGTEYQSFGRWFDAFLVRWRDGAMMPVGGWQLLQAAGADIDVAGPVLGMFVWTDNSGKPWLAFGTDTEVWAFQEGVLTDITPLGGIVGGLPDATLATGAYGDGNYSEGLYGEGASSQQTLVPAQTWTFDNFGQFLVTVAHSDGRLLFWDLNTGGELTVVDASAPIDNAALVVTQEGFIVALGARGDPRRVEWASQGTLTDWSPTALNSAGFTPLQGAGDIVNGLRAQGETLIWTLVGLWTMRFVGGSFVYSFRKVGSDCGAISRNAMTVVNGGVAYWMGHNGFWMYDGFARPMPSEVNDYVFNDMNRLQVSKIKCVPRSEFYEIRWQYCSAGSTQIDRSVSFNTVEKTWNINPGPARTAGVDKGVYEFPMMGDRNGKIYEHERGSSYIDIDGVTPLVPYAESGPLEIGTGERTMLVREFIPDENTLGDVQLRIMGKIYPTAVEEVFGPFTPGQTTDVLLNARQIRIRLDQVNPGWRWGVPRLELVNGPRR